MIQTVLEYLRNYYFMLCYPIALILSVKKYHLYFNSILKYLPILIAYTLLSELLGFFIVEFDSIQIVVIEAYSYANNLIFNIYDIIFFTYFYYIFWKTFRSTLHKNVVTIGFIGYMIASFTNPFFQDFFIFQQFYASSVGSLLLIICIVLYFKEIRRNQQHKNELLVWLSIGLFIFHCFFPSIMFLGDFNYSLYKALNLRQLHHLVICSMYICFIIGFIKTKHNSF
jgi:hypothetical protein